MKKLCSSSLPPSNSTVPKSSTFTFARVFSEEDEIKLLKSFEKRMRKYPDTTFSTFPFGKFAQSQVTSKLKRLKAKYRRMTKRNFKKMPIHDQTLFEIARKIWGDNAASGNSQGAQNVENGGDDSESVDLKNFPFLMKSMPEFENNPLYLEGLKSLGVEKLKEMNNKWMGLDNENSEMEMKKALLLQKTYIAFLEGTRKV